jgi:NDP-sugar pyrophosphorylase family protein
MLNIVVPMAGRGLRFAKSVETTPKPFIEVLPGKRMVEYVIEYLTLNEPHRFIFVCLEEHARGFKLYDFFGSRLGDTYKMVVVQEVTRGPAATALLAKDYVNDDSELLIGYCDCFFTIEPAEFLGHCRSKKADGGLIAYPSHSAMDAYMETDCGGWVLRTAEKEIISQTAAAGLYYFRKGSDFVTAALDMLASSTGRQEVFVSPVFNELIKKRKAVTSFPIDRGQRIEMGTPADLASARERLLQAKPESLRAAE